MRKYMRKYMRDVEEVRVRQDPSTEEEVQQICEECLTPMLVIERDTEYIGSVTVKCPR
jgi:hypothetical protein